MSFKMDRKISQKLYSIRRNDINNSFPGCRIIPITKIVSKIIFIPVYVIKGNHAHSVYTNSAKCAYGRDGTHKIAYDQVVRLITDQYSFQRESMVSFHYFESFFYLILDRMPWIYLQIRAEIVQ